MAGTAKNKATEKNLDSAKKVESKVDSVENNDVKKTTKKTKQVNSTKPALKDNDIIECISQIPNLSYKDNKTGDMYRWDNVGDVEEISFGVLKDIYRNHNSYIKNLYFIFSDERVIKHFRMERIYEKYLGLLSKDVYTRDNINTIQENIKALPKGIINTILNKVKSLVTNGEISDIQVIRSLEKIFDIDLIYLLDM